MSNARVYIYFDNSDNMWLLEYVIYQRHTMRYKKYFMQLKKEEKKN